MRVSNVMIIWRKYWLQCRPYGTHSVSPAQPVGRSTRTKGYATRRSAGAQSPPAVRLARHEPLLHDAQHKRVLVRLDHCRRVARKEGSQRNESWDRTLF